MTDPFIGDADPRAMCPLSVRPAFEGEAFRTHPGGPRPAWLVFDPAGNPEKPLFFVTDVMIAKVRAAGMPLHRADIYWCQNDKGEFFLWPSFDDEEADARLARLVEKREGRLVVGPDLLRSGRA
jgi:hypothetical protein